MDSPPNVKENNNSNNTTTNNNKKKGKEEKIVYSSTANPHNQKNIDLHVNRFRQAKCKTKEDFAEMYAKNEWEKNHFPLGNHAARFFIHPHVQRLLYKMQVTMVDNPHNSFGKTEGSWDNYTLMFRNGWSPGDCRKPVTALFQDYCEEIYRPLMCVMLYGKAGWEEIKDHWATFKSCTIKVCDSDQNFLGEPIFHMHIDGKIGIKQKRNYTQKHMCRLLFSIVTDTLDDMENCHDLKYGTTVYPIWQPKMTFRSNQEFHRYMQTQYEECGIKNSGLPRPHYVIPEELVYRAVSGEVLFHFSHASDTSGPQAIHSEPNPCPDRHLFVFDWNNVLNQDENGKYLESTDIPEETILKHLGVLVGCDTPEFMRRLEDVIEKATELMPQAEQYPGGCDALEMVVKDMKALLL